MLGPKSIHAEEAHKGNFIWGGWLPGIDLRNYFPLERREFNNYYVPLYLNQNPTKNKVQASLACGMLQTISKGILIGDVVLCPDGRGNYFIWEVIGDYEYHFGENFPHQRKVQWYSHTVARAEMSEWLRNSTGAIGSVSNISRHAQEIEWLISGWHKLPESDQTETLQDASEFALEKHLEDFLVKNWRYTELWQHYDIFDEDGELVGQQYPSDTGPMNILAISKDKATILVVELKKWRVSDVVVWQIQRYMGYVKAELAESHQSVRGVIIGFEDDIRIRRALSVTTNIDFFTYKIQFKLERM